LYYFTFILLSKAPLSYGWGGGTIANPDDMIWYDIEAA